MPSPPAALAIEANVPITKLTYLCPSPTSIEFAWQPVDGADSYSFQLVGPVDPAVNGGINGTFIRQFGTIEIATGQVNNASVNLDEGAITKPLSLQFQVMVSTKGGYSGMIPPSQVAVVPIPCSKNTAEVAAATPSR